MDTETPQETIITLDVPPGYKEYGRLDVYLTRFILNATRAKVQRGIKQGDVKVNGEVVRKVSHKVHPDDSIVCILRRPPPMAVKPQAIPLDIVYEDADLIVVNKAAGMVVHPAYGHPDGTLVNALLHYVGGDAFEVDSEDDADESVEDDDGDLGLSTLNARPNHPEDPAIRPGIVHRLDKDTSGLMVVAKNDVAHAKLAKQFEKRTISRRYRALVWRVPKEPEGRIETHLGRDPRNRKRMAVVKESQGKYAATNYTLIEAFAHTALLEFRLETGRTHQIRVHGKFIGHPVLNDATYGGDRVVAGPDTTKRRAFVQNLWKMMPRQALHAHTIGFVHPTTGETLHFTAELPEDMQAVLDRLRQVEPG